MTSSPSEQQLAALVDAAKHCAVRRFGNDGWAGAAAMLTEDGSVFTSVFVEAINDAASLCHETGAICEAHKLNQRVVASVCVSREKGEEDFLMLTPCGICQERLAFWGRGLIVAVPSPSNPSVPEWKTLEEVQPYHWAAVYRDSSK